jgi:hypothetical protein
VTDRRIVLVVVGVALLIAIGAGAAYLVTGAALALRVLWIAGPIALTAGAFALLQLVLPKD